MSNVISAWNASREVKRLCNVKYLLINVKTVADEHYQTFKYYKPKSRFGEVTTSDSQNFSLAEPLTAESINILILITLNLH